MPAPPLRSPGPKWASLALILAAAAAAGWLHQTGPVTVPEEPERPPKLVRTTEPRPARHAIAVTADGIVIPARQAVLSAEVTGIVTWQNPALVPGGRIREGETLFRIDPTLAELSLREAESTLARIEASHAEAERRLAEARTLARDRLIPDSELAALDAAARIEKADRDRAEAARDRARELLARHAVQAPFNALVQSEAVEVGQRVDPGYAAATLVGTDVFWVQTALPLDRLPWIRLPEPDTGQPGARARVSLDLGEGHRDIYEGRVLRILGDLEEAGRMTRVLVEIEDPLRRDANAPGVPLLLGSYVRVAIEAGDLDDVLAIERTALREDSTVWLMDTNGALAIRPVTVRWRQGETLFIDSVIGPGESLIVSDLRVALPGTKLQRQADPDRERADAPPPPGS